MPYRQTFDLTVVSKTGRATRMKLLDALAAVGLLDVQLEYTSAPEEIPGPNREKLTQLAFWAANEKAKQDLGLPSEWDQQRWFRRTSCGTACCLAGKVALDAGAVAVPEGWWPELSPEDVNRLWTRSPVAFDVIPPGRLEPVRISRYAREQLGLTESQAHLLFAGSNTLDDVLRVIRDLLTLTEDEEQAASAEL